MRFFSDNAAAAHPKVIEAIAASNRLDTAYDGDEWSKRLDGAFSDLFGTPQPGVNEPYYDEMEDLVE